jgi:hypothetical protein
MEDSSGNPVPELEGHGLTQNPAPLSFAQITDVTSEPYSNNVGFYGYNSPFYVAAPGSELAAPPSQLGDLAVEKLSVPIIPLLLDTKAKISAQLRTGDTHLGSLLVGFYDGNPQQGGIIFDIQTIPHLRPKAIYPSWVFFRPQTCGAHNIFVVAGPATAAPTAASTMVDVTIDAVGAVEALIVSTTGLEVPRQVQAQLVTKLEVAKTAFEHNFPRVAVNRLTAFIGEVEVQRGTGLTDQQADRPIGQAKQIIGCV